MPNPDFSELRGVKINPELLSRGSGERVLLNEAVVYDFMPRILGSRFMEIEELKRATHFFSSGGSFMMQEQAYKEIVGEELKEGNLVPALEAYKRSLHAGVGFVKAVSMMENNALLSPKELVRLNLDLRFGTIESKLISLVASQDFTYDLSAYLEWVDYVRKLENEAHQLNRQFFIGEPKHPDNPDITWLDPDYLDKSMVRNPELGNRLRDTYDQMQRYKSAAWVSKELGDSESEAKFEECAKTDPEENPKFLPIYLRIEDEYERARYG